MAATAQWLLVLRLFSVSLLAVQVTSYVLDDNGDAWPPAKVVWYTNKNELSQKSRSLVQVGGCFPDQFSCLDGSFCLLTKERCDGYDDCLDGSDEKQCDAAVPTPVDSSCANCGVKFPAENRIVNGEETGVNEWPWHVYVQIMTDGGTYACGGSLFKTEYVITAAHCFDMSFTNDTEVTYVRVYVGDHSLYSSSEPEEQKIYAQMVYMHSMYKKPRHPLDNDIAIIRLKYPVTFTDRVRPICLPSPDEDFTGKQLWMIGWGKLGTGKGTPDKLQEISVKVWRRRSCLFRGITKNMICANGKRKGKTADACHGDSGGGLVYNSGGRWVLAGIASQGAKPCASMPAIYTKVTHYLGWITSMTYDGKC